MSVKEWWNLCGKVQVQTTYHPGFRTAYIFKNGGMFTVELMGSVVTLEPWQRITGRVPQ